MFQAVIVSLTVLLTAVSAFSIDRPYDYGYDDGQRSTLLQLYDGLYIQAYIQMSDGNSEVSIVGCKGARVHIEWRKGWQCF